MICDLITQKWLICPTVANILVALLEDVAKITWKENSTKYLWLR